MLPWPGTILDQPARLLFAIEVWNTAVLSYQNLPEVRRKASGA